MHELYHYLYHMTHACNLPSIFEHGLLSNNEVAARRLSCLDISDPEVQRWRGRPEPVFGLPIRAYVPLYANPRNAMLYCRRRIQASIVMLAFQWSEELLNDAVYTDGNAACRFTRFSASPDVLADSDRVLRAQRWMDFPDGRRRRCAEVLIYQRIPAEKIDHVICHNEDAGWHILNGAWKAEVIVDQSYYF